ncbi:MAG: septal ring lytic transglycosylase RlpA family protein [Shewanellaceae bacterium]|nr:septal ring lytic transglycosylase RlpA family protein [Shewanellaceae bacterium]
MRSLSLALVCILFVVGCQTHSRYQLQEDAHPEYQPNLDHLPPLHPRYEPFSLRGNQTYSLFEKKYVVDKNITAYQKRGYASWYGKKFHGHQTSNGETYDMFQISAAHKTLPIPCYVRVKNLDNQKTLVVRVNDRGPFHDGRIIDLSYAAAKKLGIYEQGTAEVEVTYLPSSHKIAQTDGYYIQIAAGTNRQALDIMGQQVTARLKAAHRLILVKSLWKLQLGPFEKLSIARELLAMVKDQGFSDSYLITDTAR